MMRIREHFLLNYEYDKGVLSTPLFNKLLEVLAIAIRIKERHKK